MLARVRCIALMGWILLVTLIVPAATASTPATVYIAEVDGVINPAAADYIRRAIDSAEEQGGQALVLVLNTPGGLVDSTWEIAEAMLNARIPIIVYVAPEGAYAGSAGVFITYAAHIAAMAPNTNIGAAHPVAGGGEDIGEDLREKVTNDAVAKITTWARSHGRNAEWAEEAVRKSVSIGSDEALERNVINIVAHDLSDLLRQLDGREVTLTQGGTVVLKTAEAPRQYIEMTALEQLLHLITDPTIAYMLLSLGSLALFFELSNPGLTVAGLLGAVAILLGLYGVNVLPVNYAGLALLLFSFVLFAVDIFAPTHGALTIGAIVAFIAGSLLLFNTTDAPGVRVSLWAIFGMALSMVLLVTLMITMVVRVRKRPVTTGTQGLIGQIAEVRTPLTPVGTVFVDGALWKAQLEGQGEALNHVEVIGIDGLTLIVRPLPVSDPASEAMLERSQ